jgi:DNA polymerase III subunit gamma/tau
MIIKRGVGDLNKVYRPCKISEVVGHDTQKRMIGNALSDGTLPHSSMFVGPSGCGKTTFARIIALGLNCKEGPTPEPCCKCDSCRAILNLNSLAVLEVDSGRTGDVGTTRGILNDLPAAPMGGEPYKVAIFDEAHKLGGKSGSEDALLKFLEDTPPHVYILLCTNEPQKLKEVTRNRCKPIQFNRLLTNDIYTLLEQVCQFEGFNYTPEVLRYIAAESKGVPRASLSFLQQISSEGSWTKDAASLIINSGVDIDREDVWALCKGIMKHRSFQIALADYKKIDDTKPIPLESMRMAICGFFVGCLRKSKTLEEANKYSKIADFMSVPYFNNPKPEHILINSLFKITQILRG